MFVRAEGHRAHTPTSSSSSSATTTTRQGRHGPGHTPFTPLKSSDRTITHALATPLTSVRVPPSTSRKSTEKSYPPTSAKADPPVRRSTSLRHSRASSLGGVVDSFRNINRTSQSSVSSKLSGYQHGRRSSFSHRLSFSGHSPFGLFSDSHSTSSGSSQGLNPPRTAPAAPGAMGNRNLMADVLPPLEPMSPLSQTVREGLDGKLVGSVLVSPTHSDHGAETQAPLKRSDKSPVERAASAFKRRLSWHRSKADLSLNHLSPPAMDPMPSPLPSPTASTIPPTVGARSTTANGMGPRPFSPFRPGLQTATLVSVTSSASSARSELPSTATSDGHLQGPPRKRRSVGSSSDHGLSQRSQSPTASTNSRDRPKRAERRASQRTMLSIALQKANTAVVLDNQLCYNAAIPAYEEAAALLERVLRRVGGQAERSKLAEIRQTYLQRAFDLYQEPREELDEKALPSRPPSSNPRDSLVASLRSTNSVRHRDHASPIIQEVEEEMPVFTSNPELHTISPIASIGPSSAMAESQAKSDKAQSAVSRKSQSTVESFRIEPIVPDMKEEHDDRNESTPTPSSALDHAHSPHDARGNLHLRLVPPELQTYVPGPLTPRKFTASSTFERRPTSAQLAAEATAAAMEMHSRSNSEGTTSWLDTIDESGDSESDSDVGSVHSRSSNNALKRKQLRAARTRTQVKYDQAYDAVFAAAYGDEISSETPTDPTATAALQRVEQARERVRRAEIETELERSQSLKQKTQPLQINRSPKRHDNGVDFGYAAAELEEEEHMLAGINRLGGNQAFTFGQDKSSIPRQSASTHNSQNSRTTFTSSIASSATTAGTSFSTLADITNSSLPLLPKEYPSKIGHLPPPNPPPTAALPALPPSATAPPRAIKPPSHPPSLSSSPSRQGLRERRKSGGRVPLELKIETPLTQSRSTTPAPRTVILKVQDISRPSSRQASGPPLSSSAMPMRQSSLKMQGVLTSLAPPPLGGRQISSPLPHSASPIDGPGSGGADSASTTVSRSFFQSDVESGSPIRFHMKRSSEQLKQKMSAQNLRTHMINDPMLRAPSPQISSHANFSRRKGSTPLATPMIPTFSIIPAIPNGFQLFDRSFLQDDTSSPNSSGMVERPSPVEPCPPEPSLRPFWLMRAIQRTLTHPAGGYLTNDLFVPSGAWQTRNVKLKNVDDKISQLDLLSAALGNLNRVQHEDVDGVLKEMQLLENQLDTVQATLSKRLGSDVGFQHMSSLTRDAAPASTLNTVDEGEVGAASQPLGRVPTSTASLQSVKTRSDGGTVKTSTASRWKIKLRGKSGSASASVAPSISSSSRRDDSGTGYTALYTMQSVPMLPPNSNYQPPHLRKGRSYNHSLSTRSSSHLDSKFPPTAQSLGVSQDILLGANGNYAAAIARCCDAVQALDLVARQVEDPGLRHSSTVQVGLELSAKHASEFFGGWVCRFVVADLGVLVDKYIKRGGEWVMA